MQEVRCGLERDARAGAGRATRDALFRPAYPVSLLVAQA